jgi:broad specificity phosphatase PhoE
LNQTYRVKMVLVRHAFSEANAARLYSGTLDVDATPEGLAQVEEYRREGVYPETQRHYSSPLRRCLQTFRAAYGPDAVLDGTIDAFHELDLGDLEGKGLSEQGNERLWNSWIADGDFARGFHVESFAHACARGAGAVRDLACGCVRGGCDSVSVVTHSAIMRSSLAGIARLTPHDWLRLQAHNGLGYVLALEVDPDAGKVDLERAVPLDPNAPADATVYPRP